MLTGLFAQYKGTKHLLNGDIDLFTILETVLGTTSGALGIASILKAMKFGKTLSLGNRLKVDVYKRQVLIIQTETMMHQIVEHYL